MKWQHWLNLVRSDGIDLTAYGWNGKQFMGPLDESALRNLKNLVRKVVDQ